MLRIGTLFSGIGAIEFALKRMNIKHEIKFACDNGNIPIEYNKDKELKVIKQLKTKKEKKEYVDKLYSKVKRKNFVKESYLANYVIDEDDFHTDINLLDGTDYKNQIDLLVGGSPCQSFSYAGNRLGLNDTRGTLFYEYIRIVKEVNPKVFIYENVKGLLTHDKGKTWKLMQKVFDDLGYAIYQDILNASDYGIPQSRRRLFVIGIRNDIDSSKFIFPPRKKELKFFMQDLLLSKVKYGNYVAKGNEIELINESGFVDTKYILSEKMKKYVLSSGTKNFKSEPKINLPIARTILATMSYKHRAGVDNYVIDLGEDKLRMLTEREAYRLMGFTDEYKIVVSKGKAYKQAGNSIVVDVFISILEELLKLKFY